MDKPGEPIHALLPQLLADDASSPDRRDPPARLWIWSPTVGSAPAPLARLAHVAGSPASPVDPATTGRSTTMVADPDTTGGSGHTGRSGHHGPPW
jgi:hypothetical protein